MGLCRTMPGPGILEVSEMEIKKILWPTDFSANSQHALATVSSLSERYQAEIHVLHVVEDLADHESWYGDFDRARVDKLMQWSNETGQKRLSQICEKYLNGCPLYIKHIAVGDPAVQILKTIEKEDIDMVVMASHGEKGNFRFGGVADKIVKNAGVPVVTVPVEPQAA